MLDEPMPRKGLRSGRLTLRDARGDELMCDDSPTPWGVVSGSADKEAELERGRAPRAPGAVAGFSVERELLADAFADVADLDFDGPASA